MRAVAVVVAVLVLAAPAAAQPNLLFVLTDDQRVDAVEVMPQTVAAFPVEFETFVITTPNCCPSRSSFLTGRYAHNTGVHTSNRAGYQAFRSLEPESLGPWLQARGYYTGIVGKYFNGYERQDPVPPGWDEFYGRLYGADRGNGTTEFTLREYRAADTDTVVSYPNETHPSPYATRVFGQKGAEIIRRAHAQGRPFALFLWTVGVNTALPETVYADAPLPAWDPPPSFLETNLRDKPRVIRRSSKRVESRAFYEALRARQLRQALTIDDVVGDLTRLLDELGLRDSTVGVFTSDNGRLWGEHRLAGKVYAYEESALVPFRMMLPDAAPAVVAAQAANIDLAPTLLELAGDTTPREFDGRSLLPLLGDPAVPWRRRVIVESYLPAGFCAFREADWKYVQHRSGEEELYHLRQDPYELRNRAEWPRHRADVRAFRAVTRRSECRPPGFRPL